MCKTEYNKIIKIILLVALIYIGALQCASGQKYEAGVLAYWDIQKGLPDNRVLDIVQDKKGISWIATEGGICRFDGNHLVEISHSGENDFFHGDAKYHLKLYGDYLFLISSERGCVNIHTSTGAMKRLTKKGIQFITYSSDTLYILYTGGLLEARKSGKEYARRKIRAGSYPILFIQGQNLILFNPREEILILNRSTLKTRKIVSAVNKSEHKAGTIFENMEGDILYIVYEGIYEIEREKRQWFEENNRKDKGIHLIEKLEDGGYTIIYNNDNIRIKTNEYNLLINGKNFGYSLIKKIKQVSKFSFLIGTNQGLYTLNVNKRWIEKIDELESDKNTNKIRDRRKILEDRSGNIYLLGNPNILTYSFQNELLYPLKYKVKPSYGGTLYKNHVYITGLSGGLDQYDLNTQKTKRIITDVIKENDTFYDITVVADSLFYMGGINRVVVWSPKSNKSKEIALPGYTVFDIIYLSDIGQFYIATDRGILYTEPNNRETENTDLTFKETAVKEECKDLLWHKSTGQIWAATLTGIKIINPRNNQQTVLLKYPSHLTHPRVTALIEDDLNRVWASTYYGITCFDASKSKVYKLFPEMGLHNSEFNYKSAIKLKNGTLIFGGLSMYDVINPHMINKSDEDKSNVLKITGYSKMGQKNNNSFNFTKETDREWSFNTGTEELRLYVSTSNYITNNYALEFKINGGAWNPLPKDNILKFSNLTAQKHTVIIRLLNPLKLEVDRQTIIIHSREAFYKSETFRLLIILILFILIITIIYIRQRGTKELIKIKNRISMDLHDEVGTLLTRVSLLSKIMPQNDITGEIKDSADEAFHALRAFMNSLKLTTNLFTDLEDETREFITNQLRYTNKEVYLEYKKDKIYSLKAEVYRDIKLCIYEICTNIIKHSKCKIIRFSFEGKKNILHIYITEEFTNRPLQYNKNEGMGLTNIKKRTMRHGGNCIIKIEDRKVMIVLKFKFK